MTTYFPTTATVTIESYSHQGNYIYVENKKTGNVKYGPYQAANEKNWWRLVRHDQDIAVPNIDYRTYRFSLPQNEQYYLIATDKGQIAGNEDFTFGSHWVIDPIALRESDRAPGDGDERGYYSIICTIQNFWEEREKYLAVNDNDEIEFISPNHTHNYWWIISSIDMEIPLRHKLIFITDPQIPGPFPDMGTNDPGLFD